MSDEPSTKSSVLATLLSRALPSSTQPLRIHHVWHTPSKSDALYSPPINTPPEPTTLTSHFLALSLPSSGVLVYGIEVLIYSTSSRNTLFVSKADSTGFLTASKNTPRPAGSVIRTVTHTFLKYLLDKVRRKSPHKTTHVSLFARAQDQYLFPNSIRNSGKHVLSDRQLIRWWARCLDPVLQASGDKAEGFLLVPGLDRYECRPLFPPGAKGWTHGHPYAAEKPVRECIPHFPDDPKSRFMMEMEVDNCAGWRGVTRMDSFWELMSFRQECSLGKSVGFLSVVVPPTKEEVPAVVETPASSESLQTSAPSDSQRSLATEQSTQTATSPSTQISQLSLQSKGSKKFTGRTRNNRGKEISLYTLACLLKNPQRLKLFPRGHRIRSRTSANSSRHTSPNSLQAGRKGGVAISKKEYDRLLESLLNSDFGGRKLAEGSSKKWTEVAGGEDVIGIKVEEAAPVAAPAANAVNTITPMTVRKKRSAEDVKDSLPVNSLPTRKKSRVDLTAGDKNSVPSDNKPEAAAPAVNNLSSNLIRKKPKPEATAVTENGVAQPEVNVLSSSLVRKKPKVVAE